jgi:hypothetical protein
MHTILDPLKNDEGWDVACDQISFPALSVVDSCVQLAIL